MGNRGKGAATDLIGPLLSLAFRSFRGGRGPPCMVKKSTSGRGGSENIWKRRKEYDRISKSTKKVVLVGPSKGKF